MAWAAEQCWTTAEAPPAGISNLPSEGVQAADWLKNVLANGSATLVRQGSRYQCDQPTIISSSEAAPDFSARESRILRLMGVDECLRLHRVRVAEAP